MKFGKLFTFNKQKQTEFYSVQEEITVNVNLKIGCNSDAIKWWVRPNVNEKDKN